jgi:hypothetical protein
LSIVIIGVFIGFVDTTRRKVTSIDNNTVVLILVVLTNDGGVGGEADDVEAGLIDHFGSKLVHVVEVLRVSVDVVIDVSGTITFTSFTVLNVSGGKNNFTLVGDTEFLVLQICIWCTFVVGKDTDDILFIGKGEDIIIHIVLQDSLVDISIIRIGFWFIDDATATSVTAVEFDIFIVVGINFIATNKFVFGDINEVVTSFVELKDTTLIKSVNVGSDSEVHITVGIVDFKTVRVGGSVDIGGGDTRNDIWLNNDGIGSEIEDGTITVSTNVTSSNRSSCRFSHGIFKGDVTLVVVKFTHWNGS